MAGRRGTLHAVKILSATASTVSSRRDFKREATLLTRVNHPGIVKVQYYDETPQPYMVTEFCTSGNLWNALRAEEIKATRFAGASRSPCACARRNAFARLSHAHERCGGCAGVFAHRGVRPPRHQDGKHFAHLVVELNRFKPSCAISGARRPCLKCLVAQARGRGEGARFR